MPSFHCNNELLALAPIKYTQTDTKSFQSNQTLFDFFILLQHIFHKIAGKNQIFFKNVLKANEIARP